jgi:hypothetical protein
VHQISQVVDGHRADCGRRTGAQELSSQLPVAGKSTCGALTQPGPHPSSSAEDWPRALFESSAAQTEAEGQAGPRVSQLPRPPADPEARDHAGQDHGVEGDLEDAAAAAPA